MISSSILMPENVVAQLGTAIGVAGFFHSSAEIRGIEQNSNLYECDHERPRAGRGTENVAEVSLLLGLRDFRKCVSMCCRWPMVAILPLRNSSSVGWLKWRLESVAVERLRKLGLIPLLPPAQFRDCPSEKFLHELPQGIFGHRLPSFLKSNVHADEVRCRTELGFPRAGVVVDVYSYDQITLRDDACQ